MMSLRIPGFADLDLDHLVLDFNGTIAADGVLMSGVAPLLGALSKTLAIHVVTADTFGRAAQELAGMPLRLTILPADGQAEAKLRYVHELDADHVVAVGNGRNDRKMLEAAALAIAVIQQEGACVQTVGAADVVVTSVRDALDLLCHHQRLIASLRS